MTTITTISRNETLPTTLELLGRTVFFIFLLTTSLVISSSSINLVILGAKINLVYVVFNFMVFFLPLTFSITLIIVFSFFAELLAGFPPGFLVLLHMATLPMTRWLIKKIYTLLM